MNDEASGSADLPRRPGPFGPARDLIPENQVLLKLKITDTVATALERLADHGIDAAPVSDGINITGVFSHREASRVLSQYRGAKVDDFLAESVQAITEEPKFLDPDQWIDTSVNWIQDDWVIVGSAAEPLGILTVSDVWARLNDFAEVFVLLHEIELDIRHLIEKVLGGKMAAHFRLLEARLHGLRPGSLQALTDLSFDQYRELILEKKNGWPAFEPVHAVFHDCVFDFRVKPLVMSGTSRCTTNGLSSRGIQMTSAVSIACFAVPWRRRGLRLENSNRPSPVCALKALVPRG